MKDNEFLREIRLQRKLFQEGRAETARSNMFALMLSSIVAIILFGITSLITPFIYKGWRLTTEYYVTLTAFAIVFISVYSIRKKELNYVVVQTICGVYYVMILLLLGMLDIFPYRSLAAAFIPLLYLALPIIFIFPYIFYVVVTLGVQAVFMVLVSLYKDPVIVSSDVFRSMVGATFSLGLSWIVLCVRTKETGERNVLYQMSSMDYLTGIMNKFSSEKEVKKILRGDHVDGVCALFILDIDNFKKFNDEQGHHTGDRVLMKFGEVLTSTFRVSDIIGRIGGDEFMVFMYNVQSPELIDRKCQQIKQKLVEVSKAENLNLTCSVGVAVGGNEAITYEKMFKMADEALYEKKVMGKNGCQVHVTDKLGKFYRKRLMVVADDSEVDRAVIREFFGKDYEIYEAENGKEALTMIRENADHISVILLDLVMPVMDGYEVLRKLQADHMCSHLPVVVISADKEGEEEALELGASDMIVKPFDTSILKIRVKNAMNSIGR